MRQGKVRYIGASSGAAWEIMRALGRLGPARIGRASSSMQPHYNLLYREEEREMIAALPRAKGSA